MGARILFCVILCGVFSSGLYSQAQNSAAQVQTYAAADISGQADGKSAGTAAQVRQSANKLDEFIARIVNRERDEIAASDLFSPIIETYIQEVKFKQAFGTVPKSDYYFLRQADFRGRLKSERKDAGSDDGTFY
jgi:hypothetical protein